MRKRFIAELYLILVALMWGLTFPLILEAVRHIPPSLFVALRFFVAFFIFLPFLYFGHYSGLSNKKVLWAGIIIGVLNLFTYLFQSMGLETIPASRSAFITGSNIVMVPLLMPLFRLGWPRKIEWLSVIVALVGLYILTGSNLAQLSSGDWWTLGCALAAALTVIAIQWFSMQGLPPFLVAFYQVFFIALVSIGIAINDPWSQALLSPSVIIAVGFCAVFATCLVFYLQMRYQGDTSASRAALIYALEPVFATIFALWINHADLTKNTILGGGLVFLSLCFPAVLAYFKKVFIS